MVAVLKRRIDVVQLLLQRNADVQTIRNNQSKTAQQMAEEMGDKEIETLFRAKN